MMLEPYVSAVHTHAALGALLERVAKLEALLTEKAASKPVEVVAPAKPAKKG